MQCAGNKLPCIDIVNAMIGKGYIQQAVSCAKHLTGNV